MTNGSNRSQEGLNVQPCSSEQIPSRPWRRRKPINQPSSLSRESNKGSHSFLPRFDSNENSESLRGCNKQPYEEAKRSDPSQPTPESAPQDADEIFKKMKETGLIPNAVAMLDGLCKDVIVQEA
ncbi:pentatricopeptide repeat-containing protein [Sesbania bispinosa]|nr:pentatricopeptide repeat-containing protein [Sesbania bispinosa]